MISPLRPIKGSRRLPETNRRHKCLAPRRNLRRAPSGRWSRLRAEFGRSAGSWAKHRPGLELSRHYATQTGRKRARARERVLEKIASAAPLKAVLNVLVRGVEAQWCDGMICSVLIFDGGCAANLKALLFRIVRC